MKSGMTFQKPFISSESQPVVPLKMKHLPTLDKT